MKKKCKNFVAMGSEHVTCWCLVRLIELLSRENGWMEKQLKNKKKSFQQMALLKNGFLR